MTTSGALSGPEPIEEDTSTTRPSMKASGLLSGPELFYLRLAPSADPREVTRDEYLLVESMCGFVPAFNGEPACGHFSANGIEGWCDGIEPPQESA